MRACSSLPWLLTMLTLCPCLGYRQTSNRIHETAFFGGGDVEGAALQGQPNILGLCQLVSRLHGRPAGPADAGQGEDQCRGLEGRHGM
jgi:hypothetical protein